MATFVDGPYMYITAGSSIVLRILSYIFLRWIPGHHFPPIVYTLFVIYIPSFVKSYRNFQYASPLSTSPVSAENVEEKESPNNLDKNLKQSRISFEKQKTVIVKKQINPWLSAVTGLPTSNSSLISLATFLINLVLVLGVTDLVYRARLLHPAEDLSFARIGYVTPTEARLIVRETNASRLPIYVSFRSTTSSSPNQTSSWQAAGIITSLGNETDYTGTVTIPLPNVPEEEYQWTTSNNHTGFFTVPPQEGQLTQHGDFNFLTSSCLKARFPYNPFDHSLSISGFKYMSRILKNFPRIQFMLFLGDFIYIDVPKRFGTTVEDYRREYRQVYASPDWPLVGQNLSWIHVLDDHEIANDWDRHTTGVYDAAVDPWHHYQTAINPPGVTRLSTNVPSRHQATYFRFTQGPASFFLLDCRTYRNLSTVLPVSSTEKTMLGLNQLSDLLAFLRKPEPEGVKWKFVISSVPFTKNWQVNGLDTWAGFLHERRKILEAMWDVSLKSDVSIIILSGDRHEFAATAFPPPKNGKWSTDATVHEFSVSPLSQFYVPIPTYKQTDNEDVEVKYIPTGNSKIGLINIKKTPRGQDLNFRLFVDGNLAWSYIISNTPLTER